MISIDPNAEPSNASIIVIDVGNQTTAIATWRDGETQNMQHLATGEISSIGGILKKITTEKLDEQLAGVAIASVVPEMNSIIQTIVEDEHDLQPLFVGRQIPFPIDVLVDEPTSVGVDRICAAAAAFHLRKEACVVVDFGTAITIDAVDDNGAFIGGAILPGLRMQSKSLNRQTAQLPEVEIVKPAEPIGRNTANAIQVGVYHGIVGAVRHIVEEYATHLGRWLPAVATGGDAKLLAEDCGVFDAIVEDLALVGVGLAFDKHLKCGVVL